MSLQFIYGRSGTGKSEYIYNQIKEKLIAGSKIFIITPEQFSFTAEKKLLDVTSGSTVTAEVLSFERMAHRVFSEVGGAADINLSPSGKAMIIQSLLTSKKKELKFLGNSNENIDLVSRQFTELKKHNIQIEDLENVINDLTDNIYLKTKLQDISILYKAFDEIIKDKYIDSDDILTLLSKKISKSETLKNSIIYIDEFVGFTTQEYLVIEELLKVAKDVVITICTDKLGEDEHVSPMGQSDPIGTFPFGSKCPNKKRPQWVTLEKLVRCASRARVHIVPPVHFEELFRFKTDELKYLEQSMYDSNYMEYKGRAHSEAHSISLFLATNPYSEIEHVAQEIISLVRDNGYRYNEIGIITNNIEMYSSNIKTIFNKYEIPVFIDEKKDLNSNLLVKYVISLLDIFSKNWSYEAMFNYIKSGFLDLEQIDIYNLEKYCIKYGIKSSKWYKEDFKIAINEDLEYINKLRRKIATPLLKFKENLQGTKTVKQISTEVYKFLVQNNILEILNKKIENLEGIGELDTASELSQAMEIVVSLLDEIVNIFSDNKITFGKYTELLKTGLNNNELGKIPMTIDQVIAGDAGRSRTHKVKAIFIIGLNDGAFPSVNKQEGFINDDDRELLKEKNIELAKGTEERIYEDEFNIYKAFSTAEEKLFLSYTSSNMEGAAVRPSTLILKIKKIFVNLQEKSDIIEKQLFIGNTNTTFEDLLYNIRLFQDGKEIDPMWFEVWNWYKKDKELNTKLERALEGLKYTNVPQTISEENLEKLYGKSMKTSISKLEQYRKCPFSFHLQYGLGIAEESTFKVKPIDTGSFMHEVIDNFFEEIKNQELDIKNLDEQQIKTIIDNIINEKLEISKNYIFSSSSKFISLTSKLKKVIYQSIENIVYQLKNSDFNVFGTELEFKEGYHYKPIVLELEDGKRVEITGKIDRIDIAKFEGNKYVRIIDYKSSVKDINLNEFMSGVQIQLITYLDAVTKIEDVLPAGMLYFNLLEPVISSDKKLSEDEIKEQIKRKFKMNGMILADINIVRMMDKTVQSSQSSNIIPVYVDKSGNISDKRSNALTKEEFKQLQIYANKIIRDISREILNGDISLKPYNASGKSSCEYCAYRSVCGFNINIKGNDYRYAEKTNKDEILEKVKIENDKVRK